MAWTHVRTGRGSFDSPAEAKFSRNFFDGASAEVYLKAYVALQLVQFAMFWHGGHFDPMLAICQSISLLAVAGLFAAGRIKEKSDDQPTLVIADAVTSTGNAAAAPRLTAPGPVTSTIQIDEQSQTWADLMARISHEIRTPLNAVIGFSDLMEREIFGPLGNDRYRDYLAHIRDSGEALLRSAEDTLALSSMLAVCAPEQRAQCSSLRVLAEDAWVLVEPQASRRGIALCFSIADALDVAGDRRAFRQALSNLMLEAIQRARTGSLVEINAFAHGDTVRVKVVAANTECQSRPAQPSLAICVARALLELQGTKLVLVDSSERGSWQATTVLDLAVQPDFFSA